MPRHDQRVALRHMLDYARTAVRMVGDRPRRDLDTDEVLRLALTRAIEVIGEAAARVSIAARKEHPNIPWPQIVGVRNRLIHGYDTIDLRILWDIVTLDLPPLIAQLEAILPDESEPGS
jgi:uncharacterized protein with HEPN domain